MFSRQANYSKLKTNLRLVINRLKLLEKKKTELALKARKEISDYIQAGKDDRARIRVEHIVREDYMVEAMEMIEMYCDLLLARFGLISSQKDLDPGLEESVATLIWVTPRLQADVAELKSVAEQLTLKYSKEFAQACLSNTMGNVSEKVMHKLSVQAPPKMLIERYLIEIAKSYGVAFTPDPAVMCEDEQGGLLDIDPPYNKHGGGGGGGSSGGGGGGGSGGGGLPSVPNSHPGASFPMGGGSGGGLPYPPQQTPYPPQHQQQQQQQLPPPGVGSDASGAGSFGMGGGEFGQPPPYQPQAGPLPPKQIGQEPGAGGLNLPELPAVPSSPASSLRGPPDAGASGGASEDVDFDDLARRFEELKKRK